jgi:hypothetical protein
MTLNVELVDNRDIIISHPGRMSAFERPLTTVPLGTFSAVQNLSA